MPKKWYRLTITAVLCSTWIGGVILKAPVEAWLPLGLIGVTALGGSVVEHFSKRT